LNERIISIAAEFVAVTNLNCRQAASPSMHNIIIELMQLGASLPRTKRLRVVEIASLIRRWWKQSVKERIDSSQKP
jgi:hypothetical protein